MRINDILVEFVTPQAVAQDPGLEREKDVDVIFFGKMPRDYAAETAWAALEEVLPAEYPPGSEKAQEKVYEVNQNGGAVVTTKPLSMAKKLVATFTGYGIKSRINGNLNEFAPSGDSGGSGNYFQALASAWYNGTFDTGSLQKGIKSQQDVERLLNRGIVCPDGKTRKLHIDYNANFDGVEIYSDDYYEHGDHDDTIDSRTGQKWGPYDFMAFSDEELSEGLNEFAPPGDGDGGDDGFDDEMLKRLAAQWWNGDEDPRVERTLAAAGWEIGQDEGSYDNGGAFVVQAGDVNGNSYMSWPAEELEQGMAEAKADPTGSWVVYDGSKVKKFKTREGAKAYAEKNGGQVASSEYYHNKIQKQGMAEDDLNELSTEKLAQYKTAAGADARKADASGDYARGDKRFKGINQATIKQFDNDLKKHGQQGMAEGADCQDMVARFKQLAGMGPLNTGYDPNQRVYKNMPTAVQPKKEQR